jgi:hypothetical protein
MTTDDTELADSSLRPHRISCERRSIASSPCFPMSTPRAQAFSICNTPASPTVADGP